MSDLRKLLDIVQENSEDNEPQIGDFVSIEMGDTLLETYIEDITEDGVIVKVDETAIKLMIDARKQLNEFVEIGMDDHDDVDYEEYNDEAGMFKNDLQTLQRVSAHLEKEIQDNENLPEWCQAKIAQAKGMVVSVMDYMISQHENGIIDKIDETEMDEAKYQGREVPLGKPMAGDVKKSKVYVRKPNGKVVKVNFGDKKMRIKKSNPKRKKSFRARHHCENPGPRWKARYWSCRAW